MVQAREANPAASSPEELAERLCVPLKQLEKRFNLSGREGSLSFKVAPGSRLQVDVGAGGEVYGEVKIAVKEDHIDVSMVTDPDPAHSPTRVETVVENVLRSERAEIDTMIQAAESHGIRVKYLKTRDLSAGDDDFLYMARATDLVRFDGGIYGTVYAQMGGDAFPVEPGYSPARGPRRR